MKYILLTKLPTFASQELWRLHAEMFQYENAVLYR